MLYRCFLVYLHYNNITMNKTITVKRTKVITEEETLNIKLPFYCKIEEGNTIFKRVTENSISTLTEDFYGWDFEHLEFPNPEINEEYIDNQVKEQEWLDAAERFKQFVKSNL